MIFKRVFCLIFIIGLRNFVAAQGCSDAGFCTIGNFNAIQTDTVNQIVTRHEMDISFVFAIHGKDEKFFQSQLNYRLIKKNGRFYEIRFPFNSAKNSASNISNGGLSDLTLTYNSKVALANTAIDYSIGFRVSLTTADKNDMKGTGSYPMYLQSGLGTTDLLAVLNYNIGRYVSLGTGLQLPIFQYNKNVALFTNSSGAITGRGYRRKPDALLKVTGHFNRGKIGLSGGVLGIFHLANDHYNTSSGKYILLQSKGTTLNVTGEISIAVTNKIMFGFLYAEPFITRKNIPDGLARSRIYAPKLTFIF